MTKQELERLTNLEKEIKKIAQEEGLLTKDIIFEVVPANRVIEGMAYEFPVNFSHWSFGRDYDKHRTIYEHTGRGIPYEQVWNFEIPKAFLVETNPLALQIMVIAHVYGHVDFFLASRYSQQGRALADIAEEARNAAVRFRKYEERFGVEVEQIINAGFSIRWHQHPDPFFEEPDEEKLRQCLIDRERAKLEADQDPNYLRKPLSRQEIEIIERRLRELANKTPPEPTYDLLNYIIKHSPKLLKPWMQDVLTVIRNQARSLLPNGLTKMLNEGWATYWHVRIMRRLFEAGLITPEEHGVFNYYNSLVTQPNKKGFNWYQVGLALYEDIKERWDKGRFGRDYEECQNHYQRVNWDTKAGLGKQKIFEVRSSYSDRMAVEDLFSDDFIRAQSLYLYEEIADSEEIIDVIAENDPQVIREVLKQKMTFYDRPIITVEDGNCEGTGALQLKHHDTGYELDPLYRDRTLENIFYLWGKKVYLETKENDKTLMCSFDGHKHKNFYIK